LRAGWLVLPRRRVCGPRAALSFFRGWAVLVPRRTVLPSNADGASESDVLDFL